jgi:hypothetical protein
MPGIEGIGGVYDGVKVVVDKKWLAELGVVCWKARF